MEASGTDPEKMTLGDDAEAGRRLTIKVADPALPSKAEVEEHELTHLPYPSWCSLCTHAMGRSADHKRQVNRDHDVREIHMDYCFMGHSQTKEVSNPRLATILAVKDRDTRMLMGTIVPRKGSTHEFVAKRVKAFIDELGLSNCRLTIKTDQEPAITDLVGAIVRIRPNVETFHEQSPVGSSASNGVAERGVQTLEGQIRVLKDALENRWRLKIGEEHKVLAWLTEYAAVLLNRYEVGHDGKTSYERLRGKTSRMLGLEFGERILFRRQPIGARLAKLDSLWEEGAFLGYRSQSGETMVGTADGVFKTRTVKRMPMEKRWSPDTISLVVGLPWKPMPGDDTVDDVMPMVQIHIQDDGIPIERPRCRDEHALPRRVYIQRRDVEQHGGTQGCPGCRAILTGKPAVNHSEPCRTRLEGKMRETRHGKAKLDGAADRRKDFLNKASAGPAPPHEGDSTEKGQAIDDKDALTPKRSLDVPAAAPQPQEADNATDVAMDNEVTNEDPEHAPKRRRRLSHKQAPELDVAAPPEMERMAIDYVTCEERIVTEFEEEEENWSDKLSYATDDVTGRPLDPKGVRLAREDELRELERLEVYDVVDIDECWNRTGRAPITARWIDTNKGTEELPKYRSRFVAREIKSLYGGNAREDLFAATPPWEAVKIILSEAATGHHRNKKLMFIDISKAYLFAPVTVPNVFVDLPPEQSEPGKCALLKKALYGTRDAARAWEIEYSKTLVTMGFVPGKSSTVVFYNWESDVRLAVHGDDFVLSGTPGHLEQFANDLSKKYLVKVRGILGPEPTDMNAITVLHRRLQWTRRGLQVEADPKHVSIVFQELGLEDARGSNITGTRRELEEDDEPLDRTDTARYRSIVARCNYVSTDRPDAQFSVKELCRDMSSPTLSSWSRLKRFGRYLKRHPRAVIRLDQQNSAVTLDVFADTDYAGCRKTRRSTNGGCAMIGGHCVKSWSTTQSIVALSSGEAEYYGLVKAGCVAIGLRALCLDLNVPLEIRLFTDSSAAKGICRRRGHGKVRHIDVQYLWLQERVQSGDLALKSLPGRDNPADMMTKHVDSETCARHLARISVERVAHEASAGK